MKSISFELRENTETVIVAATGLGVYTYFRLQTGDSKGIPGRLSQDSKIGMIMVMVLLNMLSALLYLFLVS